MLTKLIEIISQFIHLSNHVVYLGLIRCYMAIISGGGGEVQDRKDGERGNAIQLAEDPTHLHKS